MNNDVRRYKLEQLSIAIIDDHEVVLEGFRSYMLKNGVGSVETFSTADRLLESMKTKQFDLFMVDVELPGTDVVELIDNIRARQEDARIVVNTMHEEMWVVRKLANKQVEGVIYKSGRLEQLLDAVIAVTDGGQYFCNKFKQASKRISLQDKELSKRELEVLKVMAQGKSTKEIAKELYISENTVETHRQNIFAKLKVHNATDLIVKAMSCGYIAP